MIKEAKNVDFYTTGKQLSNEAFKRISEWIYQKKEIKRIVAKKTAFDVNSNKTLKTCEL